jgi:hypothetical protein
LCLAFLLVSAGGYADTLIFKDDLELSGPRVEVLREHERGVDVRVSHGTITILWPRIKRIRIDYESHLANMQADGRDTPRGLYEFLQVLVRHDMQDKAAVVAGLILVKEKVAEDILLGVAKQMENQEEWTLAKKALDRVLQGNPSRRDIAGWIDRIAKNLPKAENGDAKPPVEPTKEPDKEPGNGEKEPPKEEPGDEKEPPKEEPKAVEGLEAEDDWVAEAWGNKAAVEVVTQNAQIKNKVLQVTYQGTDKDKVAVRLGGTWDLTRKQTLEFDVWNAGPGSLGLSVAFNTMPGWEFFESASKRIGPKRWVSVKLDLDARRFKSAKSKWRLISELKNRDNVRQMILLIYNTSKEGVVYVDNVRFVDKPAGK